MWKRLLVVFALVFPCALAGHLKAATFTVSFTPSAAQWTDLGAGSLLVQTGEKACKFAIADTAPANTDSAFVLKAEGAPVPLQTSLHVWAQANSSTPTDTCSVVVAPLPTAGVTSTSPAYSSISSPLGSNTKANSLSITYATDFLGQAVMASSVPVAIASNQTPIPSNVTQVAGVTLAAPTAYGTPPSGIVPGVNAYVSNSGDIITTPAASFTRPSNTTAYALGYLVANSTTAGSVTPLFWTAARLAAGNFYIRRVRVMSTGKTLSNASFRVHFYTATPTPSNGDGAAWLTAVANLACDMDVAYVDVGTDNAEGIGVPNNGGECNIALASGQTLYGLLEARAAYTPISGEVFTVIPEIHQN